MDEFAPRPSDEADHRLRLQRSRVRACSLHSGWEGEEVSSQPISYPLKCLTLDAGREKMVPNTNKCSAPWRISAMCTVGLPAAANYTEMSRPAG